MRLMLVWVFHSAFVSLTAFTWRSTPWQLPEKRPHRLDRPLVAGGSTSCTLNAYFWKMAFCQRCHPYPGYFSCTLRGGGSGDVVLFIYSLLYYHINGIRCSGLLSQQHHNSTGSVSDSDVWKSLLVCLICFHRGVGCVGSWKLNETKP